MSITRGTNGMTAVVGERLTWLRQGEAKKVTVLEAYDGGRRVSIKVEGWLSNDVVALNDFNFKRGHNWKAKDGELVPDLPDTKHTH